MSRPALFTAALVSCVLSCAAPVLADPIDARTAREMLYRGDRTEVATFPHESISEQELSVLSTVAQTQKYYAAVAISPAEGMMAEATVMAANHHTAEAARAAAIAECNGRRASRRSADCVVVMEVRPRGWEEREFQLSIDATEDFNDNYRRERGPRAFAISPSTGRWGIALGDTAADDAVVACAGEDGPDDCAVVIADE